MCKCSVVSGPNERNVCGWFLNGECCLRVWVLFVRVYICTHVSMQEVEARFASVVCLNIGYKATQSTVISVQ